MGSYLLRRLLQTLGVLFVISLVAFGLMRLAPGDPAYLALAQAGIEPASAAVTELRAELGLDQTLPMQYGSWLRRVACLNLGNSFRTRSPVAQELLARLPATVSLGLTSLALAVAMALPLGIAAAVHPHGWIDRLSRLAALVGASVPTFWLGLVLIFLFAVHLRLLPAMGRGDLRHFVLPTVTLAVGFAAAYTRLLRASMLEVLRSDFVRTARAKGLPERAVIWRHALKNAVLPLMTEVGATLAQLWGGAVIVETVFGWPGIGKFVVDSIFHRDYQVVQSFVLVMATTVTLGSLLVDIAYGWLDPRICLARSGAHA